MKNRKALNARARLTEPDGKRELNREIFSLVAGRYDRITRVLSFGCDSGWKDRMVGALPAGPVSVCVDLACGTGDIAFRLARRYPGARITGLDLTVSMLEIARSRAGGSERVQFIQADMGSTGLVTGSVDIVTGGYALRNAGDLDEAVDEVHRILRPGGTASFLDFSKPPAVFFQRLELALLRFWGGLWGWIYHGDPEVYGYIADSLERFPDRRQLQDRFRAAGFSVVSSELHFLGFMQRLTVRKAA